MAAKSFNKDFFDPFVEEVAKAVWARSPLKPEFIRTDAYPAPPNVEPTPPIPAPIGASDDNADEAFTVTETCDLLKISKALLYGEWRRGRGPEYVQIGATRRISRKAINKYLAAREPASAAGVRLPWTSTSFNRASHTSQTRAWLSPEGQGKSMDAVSFRSCRSALRVVLETACAAEGVSLEALTVLAKQNDPYRLDTPTNHAEGQWFACQIERFTRPDRSIHLRGLHYALVVQGNVRKPDRRIYRNTDEDWRWLVETAAKAARWLGYVDFERISDHRNDEPVANRVHEPAETPGRILDAGASLMDSTFELGAIHIHRPNAFLARFRRPQPYALTIFGEKSSLREVLEPIAARTGADLYLATGEISETLVYRMAKDGVADGRPMVVVTVCDFDPAGRQMPVSIGRKLQASHDLLFPDLEFKVVPVALTVDQVRELGLPSTPLKKSERRADKWKAEFGVEQTEIDALMTPLHLQSNVLRRIVEEGLAPYYDATLNGRVRAAEREWEAQAQAVIDEHVDPDALAEIESVVEAIEADATARLETLKAEIEERVNAENARLQDLIRGIRLPAAPTLPEAELEEEVRHAVLVSSDWDWADQTRALKARKTYGEEEGRP